MVQTSFKKLLTLEKRGEEKLVIVEEGKLKPGCNLVNLEKGEKKFVVVRAEGQGKPGSRRSEFSYWLHEKIWTFLVLTCPYPFYFLLVGISQHSPCINQFEPISFLFLMGLFGTLELTNFTLFSPPKKNNHHHHHEEYDLVNFEKPEDIQYPKDGDTKLFHLIHCFFCVTSLWAWTLIYLEVFQEEVEAKQFFFESNFICAAITTILFIIHYFRGRWMQQYNAKTLLTSIGLLAVATSSFLMRFTCDCSTNFSQISASIALLAAILHIRFAFNFQNPPRWVCMLTIRHLRELLVYWYLWFILCICSLWISLFALVIGSANNGSCSEWFYYSLFGSSIAVVIGLTVKLVMCYWSRKVNLENS